MSQTQKVNEDASSSGQAGDQIGKQRREAKPERKSGKKYTYTSPEANQALPDGSPPPLKPTRENRLGPIQASQSNRPLKATREGQLGPVQAKQSQQVPKSTREGKLGAPQARQNQALDTTAPNTITPNTATEEAQLTVQWVRNPKYKGKSDPPVKVTFAVTQSMSNWSEDALCRFALRRACNAEASEVTAFFESVRISRAKLTWVKKAGITQGARKCTISIPAKLVQAFLKHRYQKMAPKKVASASASEAKDQQAARKLVFHALLDQDQKSELEGYALQIFQRQMGALTKLGTPEKNVVYQQILDQILIIFLQSLADLGALKQPHAQSYLRRGTQQLQQAIRNGDTPPQGYRDFLSVYYSYQRIAMAMEGYTAPEWAIYTQKGNKPEYLEVDRVLQSLENNRGAVQQAAQIQQEKALAASRQLARLKEALDYLARSNDFGVSSFWMLPQPQRDEVVAQVKKKYPQTDARLLAQAVNQRIAEDKRQVARREEKTRGAALNQKRVAEGKSRWTPQRLHTELKREAGHYTRTHMAHGFGSGYTPGVLSSFGKMRNLIEEYEALKATKPKTREQTRRAAMILRQLSLTYGELPLPRLYNPQTGQRVAQEQPKSRAKSRPKSRATATRASSGPKTWSMPL